MVQAANERGAKAAGRNKNVCRAGLALYFTIAFCLLRTRITYEDVRYTRANNFQVDWNMLISRIR